MMMEEDYHCLAYAFLMKWMVMVQEVDTCVVVLDEDEVDIMVLASVLDVTCVAIDEVKM